MLRADSSALIERTPESVFEFVALDFFRNYPRWSPEVVALTPLTPGPLRAGALARQVRVDRGRRTEATFRLTELEPCRAVAFEGVSTPFVIAYRFEPAGSHTRVTFSFQLLRLEFYMRPFERLIRAAARDGVAQTLRNLKALVEREVAPAQAPPPLTVALAPSAEVPPVLRQVLDACVNGATLVDPAGPDQPLVYVNPAFERLSGYAQDELLGRNCRLLHREDRDQPGLAAVREAISALRPATVLLRNYRRQGGMFWNRVSILPLLDPGGRPRYFLGVQRDLSAEVRAPDELEQLALRLRALGTT
ncbi:MAG TPA: SRPBCC family protein [Pelomicrobium sp.]|nr:SRPBCC family protein [Pelomicrobium sp.]